MKVSKSLFALILACSALLCSVSAVKNHQRLGLRTSLNSKAKIDATIEAYLGISQKAHAEAQAKWFWGSDEEETEEEIENVRENPADVINQPQQGLRSWIENDCKWDRFRSQNSKKYDFPPLNPNGSKDPVMIEYVKCTGSGNKGAIVYSPGQSEACTKYDENIYDLTQEGFSPVYCIDHRGQGKSSRMLDDELKGHIDDGEDFIADFTDYVNIVKDEVGQQTTHLICHSMGCAITFRYLIQEYENDIPQFFSGVVAYAPLIKPKTDPFPYWFAKLLGQGLTSAGRGEDWAPTKEATFDESYHERHFATSTTHSYSRWSRTKENCVLSREKIYNEHKGQCYTGVTAQFAYELFLWVDAFHAFYKTNGKLTVPILLQQAETDALVENTEQDKFCSDGCSNCEVVKISGSKHNIWTEVDHVRSKAMSDAFVWISKNQAVVKQGDLPKVPEKKWWHFW